MRVRLEDCFVRIVRTSHDPATSNAASQPLTEADVVELVRSLPVQDGSSLGSDSHSCPTCKGNVILGIHYLSDPYTGEALPPQEEICPDCNPQESSDDR